MKTSKLLNKQFLSIIAFALFLGLNSYSEEQPVDIWNLDKKEIEEISENTNISDTDDNQINEPTIYMEA